MHKENYTNYIYTYTYIWNISHFKKWNYVIFRKMEIIMLNEISQAKKPNMACSHSFVELKPKMMMTAIVIDIM
jgi:hypothetical protein